MFVSSEPNWPNQQGANRRVVLGAALLWALALAGAARPAAAQQQQQQHQRSSSAKSKTAASKGAPASAAATSVLATPATEIVCDSVAAPAVAPRKLAAARPRPVKKARVAPRAAAVAAARPKPKRTVVAAAAGARKRRPTKSAAAGHRAAAPVVARRTAPPQCHAAAVVAAPPQVGAIENLVSSLPWTASAPAPDVTFPVATAPTLAELGGIGLRTGGTLAAGLLGAGAFWLKSGGDDEQGRAIVPPEGPGGPETPGGPNGPPPITTVPEPATLALVASGLAAITGARTRRRRTR